MIFRRSLAGIALLACCAGLVQAKVKTGLDVLEAQGFAPLRGKRVGVITNQTGVNSRGKHIVQLLKEAPDVKLAAIFSPEHGFTGRIEHGQLVGDTSLEDVPVYSLYGKTKRPAPETLQGIDVLVFDIQDAGTRFYTYITTLGYALEEAAKAGIEFYVLDRPNPVTGVIVEGEILDPDIRHFTAYYSIPTRHGMTMGEIAQWHNDKAGLNAKLHVVKMEGWDRGWWDHTGLNFIPPSPNIRHPGTALLYCGVGAFEATNVSVGRGTPTPFGVFGAPWADSVELARRLNALKLPGVRFRPIRFTPEGDNLYAGQSCQGVRLVVQNRTLLRPVDVFVHAACILRDLHPKELQLRWDEVPYVAGSKQFEKMFTAGASAQQILQYIHTSADSFLEQRKPYLLYP